MPKTSNALTNYEVLPNIDCKHDDDADDDSRFV